jgi:alcohol dehydrogenase (cytochrome c)
MNKAAHWYRNKLVVFAAVLPIALVGAIAAIPPLRWRAEVLILQLTGKIPAIETRELLRFMIPGPEQQPVARLIETRNPFAVLRNLHVAREDIQAGAKIYQAECAVCHGPDGSGGPGGPSLTGRTFKNGESDWAIYRTIRLGVPGTAMQKHPLAPVHLWQLIAFIHAIDIQRGIPISSAETAPIVEVPSAEIAATDEPAEDWLTYAGSYRSTRHSLLREISTHNVAQLALRWQYQSDVTAGKIEASPIVRHGILFTTVPQPLGRVMALDAATGKLIWSQQYAAPANAAGGEFGAPVNRGVAILDDKIYMGTSDAHLIAMSAATGKQIWNVGTSNDPTRYYISAAPLAYGDLVVIGVGTKGGGVAYIVAYDAKTGGERWRFMAIPGPGERGHETWSGDSWKEGGAPTWLTGSYDAKSDTLIWGIGNPKPDYNPSARAGDNLYSDSVVALQGTTGKLKWYFQFTPADERDWDSNQTPVLVDRPTPEGTEKQLLWANRNGFFYILDRDSGKFQRATPFVQQTWTDGIDSNGRPMQRADLSRHKEGYVVFPGNEGGTNWWTPSLDFSLNLFFVPVVEQGMVFYSSGDDWPTPANRTFYTAVRALDARTGIQVWEYKHSPRAEKNETGGVLTTAGGLLFGSDLGVFFALDSRTGKYLWSVETGSTINAPPITYSANGDQFVVITSGRNTMAFALPKSVDGVH